MKCNLCPRNCNVDRSIELGYCGGKDIASVAHTMLHFWEEPCISGKNGSGCVFFSGCQLRCVYCQNRKISRMMTGKEKTPEELAEIYLALQVKNANNINLVTPDHFALQICQSIAIARAKGLSIPTVWNCSGYVNVPTLRYIEKYVDIYLTDFKYFSSQLSQKYSFCDDYFDKASKALEEMVRQHPKQIYDENGMMKSGVIVRHLVLPFHTSDSMKIIEYLYQTYGDSITVSIMSQFTPIGLEAYPEINRRLTTLEYQRVVDYAVSLGMKNAFAQSRESAKESFIPYF